MRKLKFHKMIEELKLKKNQQTHLKSGHKCYVYEASMIIDNKSNHFIQQ